jgi:class 3 adenylate cyclase
MARPKRTRATLLSADAVGFSRFMEHDDTGRGRRAKVYHALPAAAIDGYRGCIAIKPGAAVLAGFGSASDACAFAAHAQARTWANAA